MQKGTGADRATWALQLEVYLKTERQERTKNASACLQYTVFSHAMLMCIVCQCVSCLLIASHHVTVCNIVCCLTFIAFHVVQILSPFGARHDARGSGTCKKKSKIKECVNLVLRKFCPDYSHLLYLIGWPNVESPPCRVWGVIVFSGKWLFWWHGFCVEGLHAQLASPESKTTESSQITYLSHSV